VKLAENLKTLFADMKPLQEEKELLEKELETIKTSLDKLKADYTEAEKELEIVKKDETTEIRKYESLKHSFERSQRRSRYIHRTGKDHSLHAECKKQEKLVIIYF
jgi:SMC interacting uncharacterized protein involved in chromosome segregation